MSNSKPGKTSDEEVLQAIRDHYSPAVGTVDLSEAVGVSRQAIYERLQNLEADGLVEKYTVSRDTVWYLTPAGERFLDKN
jgi:DNA-binding Lrp family transcriptional regulator